MQSTLRLIWAGFRDGLNEPVPPHQRRAAFAVGACIGMSVAILSFS